VKCYGDNWDVGIGAIKRQAMKYGGVNAQALAAIVASPDGHEQLYRAGQQAMAEHASEEEVYCVCSEADFV
jgi:hypothetical protein